MTAPKLRVPKDPIPLDSAEAVEYWLASGRIGRVRGWRSTLATLSSGPNRQIRSPAAREARAKMRAAARSLRAAFVAADWLAWERAGMEFNLALANLRIAHMAPLALKGKASIDGGAAGGAEGAKTKKAAADEWQISIEPKVERFIRAGLTNWNIAARVASDAKRDVDTASAALARQTGQLAPLALAPPGDQV